MDGATETKTEHDDAQPHSEEEHSQKPDDQHENNDADGGQSDVDPSREYYLLSWAHEDKCGKRWGPRTNDLASMRAFARMVNNLDPNVHMEIWYDDHTDGTYWGTRELYGRDVEDEEARHFRYHLLRDVRRVSVENNLLIAEGKLRCLAQLSRDTDWQLYDTHLNKVVLDLRRG
jgi:hypothetical protein